MNANESKGVLSIDRCAEILSKLGARGMAHAAELREARAAVAELAKAVKEQSDARCAVIYAGLSYDKEAATYGSRMQRANQRVDAALAHFNGEAS